MVKTVNTVMMTQTKTREGPKAAKARAAEKAAKAAKARAAAKAKHATNLASSLPKLEHADTVKSACLATMQKTKTRKEKKNRKKRRHPKPPLRLRLKPRRGQPGSAFPDQGCQLPAASPGQKC
jgi:hypothetical protein